MYVQSGPFDKQSIFECCQEKDEEAGGRNGHGAPVRDASANARFGVRKCTTFCPTDTV